MNEVDRAEKIKELINPCISRRRFLFLGAAAIGTVLIEGVVPNRVLKAEVVHYERTRIASLSELRNRTPRSFRYPWDHANAENILIKLGEPAGGGVGPDSDVVAFNTLCPHMGFPMKDTYKPDYQALGPCGWHFSTYDLTRHGMIISGHATQGLPQITLEVEGDDIFATGVMGLIFGFGDNEEAPVS